MSPSGCKTEDHSSRGAELKEQISRSSRRPAFPEIFRKNLTALRQHGKEQRNEDEERTRKKRREDQLKPGASLENSIPLGFNLHVFSSSSCSFFFPPLLVSTLSQSSCLTGSHAIELVLKNRMPVRSSVVLSSACRCLSSCQTFSISRSRKTMGL